MGRVALRRMAISALVSLFASDRASGSETETKTEQTEPQLNAAEVQEAGNGPEGLHLLYQVTRDKATGEIIRRTPFVV